MNNKPVQEPSREVLEFYALSPRNTRERQTARLLLELMNREAKNAERK
jgi:hypothetical protein